MRLRIKVDDRRGRAETPVLVIHRSALLGLTEVAIRERLPDTALDRVIHICPGAAADRLAGELAREGCT
jgi:hypothetical protein